MNEVIQLLEQHRSIRRFKDEPVPEAHIRAAVQAGQAASTSSAVQAYSLIQITDPDVRAKLVDATGGQSKVARCGAFFVVCGDARRHRLIAERAGQPYDAKLEAFLVAAVDAALFAQNMVIAFESLGYGICYIGGLRNQLDVVDELLGLPLGVYPLFGLCVGVPDQDPSHRPRLPVETVWMKDRYADDAQILAQLDAYDAGYRDYLEQRGARPRGWTDGMAKKHATPQRAYLGRYYADKGADTT